MTFTPGSGACQRRTRVGVTSRAYALVAGLTLLVCALASADEGDYTGHEHSGSSLTVFFTGGQVTLTPYGDASMVVHYERPGMRQLPSYAVAAAPPAVATTLRETAETLHLDAGKLRAVIARYPVRIAWYRNDIPLVEEAPGLFVFDTLRGFRFRLSPDEKLIGGGERVLGMDRRGHRLPMYQRPHYGYSTESTQMYFGLPAVLSSKKYLLLFDNSATGTIDIGNSEADILQFEAVGGRTAYVIATGDTYPEVIESYVGVTGRQPLPPRWAFGNFASRFGYRSEAQTRDIVQQFKDMDFPLDAVVLDLYWFGPDVKGHVGNLDWDRNAFPDPQGMMADFERLGVKTILITEPFVLTTSKRWDEAVAAGALAKNLAGEPKRFDFYFGNTGLIDVFDARASAWFWSIYRSLAEQGVAGWWGDLGEPEVHPTDTVHAAGTADEIHNAYGHKWAQLLFDNLQQTWPQRRPMIMMRSGFAGSQRFGMIPWTGDVSRSWGGLVPQVELSLQMSLLGLAYTHSDLGGFAGGERFDRELYVRWLQYGVFQPVYRPHAQDNIPPEPVFHDKRTQDIVRDYIKLRYRLLPYVYTLAYQNSSTGMPLMRPLFFEDEEDLSLIDYTDAYLWGDAFLVAPIVAPGVSEKAVKLPAGAWFDFWTGRRYEGGRTATIPVTFDTIPVLVRAGSFVPMIAPIGTTRDYSSHSLTVHYYADNSVARASGSMFDDDGTTHRSIDNGKFELLAFSARQSEARLEIDLSRTAGSYDGMPMQRDMLVTVHNAPADLNQVTLAGFAVPVTRSAQEFAGWQSGAYHDAGSNLLQIRFTWSHVPVTLAVH